MMSSCAGLISNPGVGVGAGVPMKHIGRNKINAVIMIILNILVSGTDDIIIVDRQRNSVECFRKA